MHVGNLLELSYHSRDILLPMKAKTLTPAELKYDIYEKKLTAVIHALKIRKHLPIGNVFIVETHHQSLKYFLTQKKI